MEEPKLSSDNNENVLSVSMMVDKKPSNSDFDQIHARTLNKWVEDSTVSNCISCNKTFGFLTRKHHCRCCGYIFCSYCSNKYIIIPEHIKVPKPNSMEKIHDNKPKRVCEQCYKKIKNLNNFEPTINKLEKSDLNIFEIKTHFKEYGLNTQQLNYYLSKFREIQYLLPNHSYSKFEKHILWTNRKLFVGHCFWITHLLNSLDYEKEYNQKKGNILQNENKCKIREILSILSQHKQIQNKNTSECWKLMCTRHCQPYLTHHCTLMLLDRKILCKNIHEYAIKYLDNIPDIELICYIQYLVENAAQSPFSVISDWLIQKCSNNLIIANKVFWAIQNGLNTQISMLNSKYNSLLIYWKESVSKNIQQKIYNNYKLVQIIKKNYNSSSIHDIKSKLSSIKNTILPTSPEKGTFSILPDGIKIKSSATSPLLLPFQSCLSDSIIHILYKPEDLRKEQIIMDIIKIIRIILDKENIDVNIITYNIQPVGLDSGFVEIVQNSKTLYDIRFKNNSSLLHYILMKNKKIDVGTVLERFMKSCASYCVISFLLGVGDRHLENIMISDDGSLFHIDYGYILGMDPKFISTSDMRIADDMIDVMGGINSEMYQEFKKLCEEIFNCLRRHVNIFTCLLNLLSYSQPPIQPKFTKRKILSEIEKRFLPGETHQQAQIQIHNRIDNSTSASYRYRIIDFFHRQMDHDEGLFNHINSTFSNSKYLFQSFIDYIPSFHK